MAKVAGALEQGGGDGVAFGAQDVERSLTYRSFDKAEGYAKMVTSRLSLRGQAARPYSQEYGFCYTERAMPPRTYVYVDGFNLYYGAVKDTKLKWLNLRQLCRLLLPGLSVDKIKYFTARVSGRKEDPDKPTRQQIYLRALRTLPNLEIIYGSFLSHDVFMPLAEPEPGGPRFAKVVRTEEKGSDVNIAAHLLNDAYKGAFDVAVLVTNDSDLLEPIRLVRREFVLQVGILNPHEQTPSQVLLRHASFMKQIRHGVLAASQFPAVLRDSKGTFHKPEAWR